MWKILVETKISTSLRSLYHTKAVLMTSSPWARLIQIPWMLCSELDVHNIEVRWCCYSNNWIFQPHNVLYLMNLTRQNKSLHCWTLTLTSEETMIMSWKLAECCGCGLCTFLMLSAYAIWYSVMWDTLQSPWENSS